MSKENWDQISFGGSDMLMAHNTMHGKEKKKKNNVDLRKARNLVYLFHELLLMRTKFQLGAETKHATSFSFWDHKKKTLFNI